MSDSVALESVDERATELPGSKLLREFCFHGRKSMSSSVAGGGVPRLVTTTGARSLRMSFFDSGVLISTIDSNSESRQQRTCVDEFYSIGCGDCCCCCSPSPAFSTAVTHYDWHFIKRNTLRDVHVHCQEINVNSQKQLQSQIDFFWFQDICSALDGVPTSFTVALDPAASADFFTFTQGYMLSRKWEVELVVNQHSVLSLQAGATLPHIQQVHNK